MKKIRHQENKGKWKKLIYALIIALILLLIALLHQQLNIIQMQNQYITQILNHMNSVSAYHTDQLDYQNNLLKEIVMNQHQPSPQPQSPIVHFNGIHKEVQPIQHQVIHKQDSMLDIPTVIKLVPFIPVLVEKITHAFSFSY